MSRRSRAPICRNQRLRGVLDAATTPLNELSEVIQKEPRTPVGQGRLLLEWQEALDICEEEEAADGAPPRPEETASGRVVAAELAAMLEERLAEDASRWAREAPRGRGSCQSPSPRGGRRATDSGCLLRILDACYAQCFNPRPRVGGDLSELRRRTPRACFNPRPRVGGD